MDNNPIKLISLTLYIYETFFQIKIIVLLDVLVLFDVIMEPFHSQNEVVRELADEVLFDGLSLSIECTFCDFIWQKSH